MKKKNSRRKKRRSEHYSHKACTTDIQRYCLLKKLERDYADNPSVDLPPTTRNRKTTIIGRIVDVDYRYINRILSRGSFAESIVWRLQTYYKVHDFDAFKAVSEAIGKRNSITCYCGEKF